MEEVIRNLSENQFRKIKERSVVLSSFTRNEVGLNETVYLVLVSLGGKKKVRIMGEMRTRYQGRLHSSWYIEYISPEDAIEQFDLRISQIESMVEPARKLFLDYIEEEEVPDF